MKKQIKILSLFLSIIIIFISFFQCGFTVYATSSGVHPDPDKPLGNIFFEGGKYAMMYLLSQLGALTDGDFFNFMQNKATWDDYWNGDNITVSEDGTITFSDDLVKYIKQALKEYAEETNGYIILPTVPLSTLTPSTFTNSYQYQTVKSMVNEYGVLFIRPSSSYLRVGDVSSYKNNEVGFYIMNSYSSYYSVNLMHFMEWSLISSFDKCIKIQPSYDKVIHTWDEAESSASSSDGLYYYTVSSDKKSCDIEMIRVNKSGVYDVSPNCINLISKDGRNILVFKSKEALQNYSVDHRTVYFGSKFYEDTGSVTGSYDDFQDWLDGKYDDLLDRLKDLIPEGSNISEDDLQKIIDKLLGGLDEIGDKIDEGNKETNNLLQQILASLNSLDATMASALSGVKFDTSKIEDYLSSILVSLGSIKNDLDDILDKLDEMAEDEVDDKSNALVEELSTPFSEIVDVLKTKFPFSLPDDIKGLFVVLNGGNEPGLDSLNERLESYNINSNSDSDADKDTESDVKLFDLVVYSDWNSGVNSDDNIAPASYMNIDGDFNTVSDEEADSGIVSYAHEENPEPGSRPDTKPSYISMDKYGAPIFRFPIEIKSYGFSSELVISMSRFRIVSRLSRRLFLLIFLQQLMLLSIKIFDFMKGMIE